MTMSGAFCALLLVSSLHSATALAMLARANMNAKLESKPYENPIRKVVNVLEAMLKKAQEEGEVDDKLCEEARCHCVDKIANQRAVVEKYKTQLIPLEMQYKKLFNEIEALKLEYKAKNKELKATEEALAEAIALHEKQYADVLQAMKDYKKNILAMEQAIAALYKGLDTVPAASFLQSDGAKLLRKLVASTSSSLDISDYDRDALTAFLNPHSIDQDSFIQDESEMPSSSEIIGMLKQMREMMMADLKVIEDKYMHETIEYQNYKKTMEYKVQMLKEEIDELMMKSGELRTSLMEIKALIHELLHGGYIKEKHLLEQMIKACTLAQHTCETAKQLRYEEYHALQEAIQLLSADESLDLFKATLPPVEPTPEAASFLQVAMNQKELLNRARSALNAKRQGHRDNRLDVISLVLQGRKVDMTKVTRMIDTLIRDLKQEELDEVEKRGWCIDSLGDATFKKHFLDKKTTPIRAKIVEIQAELDELNKQLDELVAARLEMNKAALTAMTDRKAEHNQYVSELAADKAALELLEVAKLRLTNFYNSFLQMKIMKPQDASKVLHMIDTIIHDLELHIQENTNAEKFAEADYQEFVKEAAEARLAKSKIIDLLSNDKAVKDNDLQNAQDDLAQYLEEEATVTETIMNIHRECDHLVKYFDIRIEARNNEIKSLQESKAVLQGAEP